MTELAAKAGFSVKFGPANSPWVACSEKQLFLNFKQLASFSHYVTIQELPKKILELSQLQKQGPRDPAFQGEKLYIYYMNIAQNYPKIHVSEKTAFLRSKNDFQPKTKVVPNTSSNCKTNKKNYLKKKYFWGVLGVPKIAKNAKNTIFEDL